LIVKTKNNPKERPKGRSFTLLMNYLVIQTFHNMYRWSTQIGEVMPSRRTVLRNAKLDSKGRILKSKALESAPVESAEEESSVVEKVAVVPAPRKVDTLPKKKTEAPKSEKAAPSKKQEEKKVESKEAPSQKKSKK
jgi:hypothetical protein